MTSHVSEYKAAPSDKALAHFQGRLSFEADCWDVYDSGKNGTRDYVILDVRGPNAYAKGHVPGAINLPHREISSETLAEFAPDTLFVVYCAGPHCNGANKAAIALAKLGRPVKEMIGGVTGWLDEGLVLEARAGETGVRGFCKHEAPPAIAAAE
ncbi:MAG TPA: rhodanese-like domain-containing protein [Allosphingosinicella sp.]|uniref:rhodanese-like domain-containing protein n=1 Tax=Allosphingosinicella sp. TaxID=2823234 RepID=UPI002ED80ECB